MLLGAHYAVDVLATVVLFAASVGVYRVLALSASLPDIAAVLHWPARRSVRFLTDRVRS